MSMTIEHPRNTIFERTPEGVLFRKYVGEPGTSSHRTLWDYHYTSKEWADIAKEMAEPYVPPPEPEPEPDPLNDEPMTFEPDSEDVDETGS